MISLLGSAPSWVGTVPTWMILAIGLLVAYRVTKGGGGSAVSELSKANEVLTKRVHELGAEVRDLRVENERLKSRTDFALALSPLLEWTAGHEERAQQRHEGTMNVLALIAERLGPEHE